MGLTTSLQRSVILQFTPTQCKLLNNRSISLVSQANDARRMNFPTDLQEMVIGVEATAYLQTIIEENPEPLLAALGGFPLVLKENIETELNKWKENNMRPVFIFEGQSVVNQEEVTMRNAKAALDVTQTAWNLYGENKPTEAVAAFGASGMS